MKIIEDMRAVIKDANSKHTDVGISPHLLCKIVAVLEAVEEARKSAAFSGFDNDSWAPIGAALFDLGAYSGRV